MSLTAGQMLTCIYLSFMSSVHQFRVSDAFAMPVLFCIAECFSWWPVLRLWFCSIWHPSGECCAPCAFDLPLWVAGFKFPGFLSFAATLHIETPAPCVLTQAVHKDTLKALFALQNLSAKFVLMIWSTFALTWFWPMASSLAQSIAAQLGMHWMTLFLMNNQSVPHPDYLSPGKLLLSVVWPTQFLAVWIGSMSY